MVKSIHTTQIDRYRKVNIKPMMIRYDYKSRFVRSCGCQWLVNASEQERGDDRGRFIT